MILTIFMEAALKPWLLLTVGGADSEALNCTECGIKSGSFFHLLMSRYFEMVARRKGEIFTRAFQNDGL
jgi:hypothetical protein